MSWAVPSAWPFVLLALAAWRTFRIVCCDTIFDRPRAWLCGRLGDKFTESVECPFCAGFYCAVGWWLGWIVAPFWALVVAVPFALSAVVALIEVNLGPE